MTLTGIYFIFGFFLNFFFRSDPNTGRSDLEVFEDEVKKLNASEDIEISVEESNHLINMGPFTYYVYR